MKFIVSVISLVAYVAAEPICPPANDTETVLYFPHPTDCSKFLTCHGGNLVELICPIGTYWNDNVKACDFHGNVACSSQPETTTAPATTTTEQPSTTTTELLTTTTTTTSPTTEFQTTTTTTSSPTTGFETTTVTSSAPVTPPAPTGKCPDTPEPEHDVFLPHEDCTKYYICTWDGIPVERDCPPNLHWNQQLSQCDYPYQAGCVPGHTTVSTGAPVSTSAPGPNTTPAPFPSDRCPPEYDPNHQVYFPHADCTKYYICTPGGSKLEQICPPGLHWSQTNSYCDRPELAQCQPGKQADECPEGYDPENPTFVPHEQDCGRYFVCYDGQLIEHQCAHGLYWDQNAGKCAAAEEVDCVVATATAPTVPECPEVTDEPAGDYPAFFPHEDCSKYYVCSNGYAIEMECPEGTFWNAEESVCDAPGSSGCENRMNRWGLIRV